MNFFHHKDPGNHLLQLCPKVVKHPVLERIYYLFNLLTRIVCGDNRSTESKTLSLLQALSNPLG